MVKSPKSRFFGELALPGSVTWSGLRAFPALIRLLTSSYSFYKRYLYLFGFGLYGMSSSFIFLFRIASQSMSLKNDFFIISFAVIRRFGSTLKMFCRRSRVAWSMSRGNFMSPWMACFWIIIGSSISLNGNPLQNLRSKELLTVNIAHIAKCHSSRCQQQNCSHDLIELQGLCILMYHNWLLS